MTDEREQERRASRSGFGSLAREMARIDIAEFRCHPHTPQPNQAEPKTTLANVTSMKQCNAERSMSIHLCRVSLLDSPSCRSSEVRPPSFPARSPRTPPQSGKRSMRAFRSAPSTRRGGPTHALVVQQMSSRPYIATHPVYSLSALSHRPRLPAPLGAPPRPLPLDLPLQLGPLAHLADGFRVQVYRLDDWKAPLARMLILDEAQEDGAVLERGGEHLGKEEVLRSARVQAGLDRTPIATREE